jgi:sporulation integral membrane protein YlbJ
MTRQPWQTKKAERPKLGGLCLSLLLFFSLALMLRRADVAANYMREGLTLCARAIVPSLFPFMVLSELLVTSGVGEWLSLPLERPLGKLLGLPRAGCCAVFLGLLCGFPIGARCAILAYEKGTLDQDECERALACSSIPSAAFLISTVGTTLWKDAKFGVFLYASAVLAALLSGILLYVLQKAGKGKKEKRAFSPPAKVHFEAGMFPTTIKNATLNTLLICAYVVFFCTLTGTVDLVINRFTANEITHAILSALLELSGGVSAISKLANQRLATVLTGAAVGWSGTSIHCQMLSLCDGHNLSTRLYLRAKLWQMILCATMMFLFIRIFS